MNRNLPDIAIWANTSLAHVYASYSTNTGEDLMLQWSAAGLEHGPRDDSDNVPDANLTFDMPPSGLVKQ